MKHLKLLEEFAPDMDYAPGGKYGQEVDLDEQLQFHLLMRKGKAVFAQSYDDLVEANKSIAERLKSEYMIEYLGPDVTYVEESLD